MAAYAERDGSHCEVHPEQMKLCSREANRVHSRSARRCLMAAGMAPCRRVGVEWQG